MEAFVTHDEMENLVKDLITAETWKLKVFPLIHKEVAALSSIKSYMCMYHEASICNLLEVMLYHKTACESSDDALVEIIDYCHRKFVLLNTKAEQLADARKEPAKAIDPKTLLNMSPKEELQKQADEIEFSCSMISFSLVRFITDHVHELPVPIVHQLMEVSDMPCVLVPLIETKPWLRKNQKGNIEKFEDQKWQVVDQKDSNKVTKIEAQIWLAIYNMFSSQDANRKYEVTSFRKANLLRLRKYLNEHLLDQLPMLVNMLRALEEMSMMSDNAVA